ncbi:hypothetical protein [Algoriphagus resistens]|uniref:hypothetical protein n=1 Tax=Algoriphagus resistens TaxID=1750590 RepID=UPI000716A87C|nr:hypothetical protein [Algoriphagus resistens]
MRKVLIAIEREKFNYLFKYNEAEISLHRIIDLDYNSLGSLPVRSISKKIESALPYFESEDEVILLEYVKEKINMNNGIRISFDGVLGIIPTSGFAFNSLKSRLNPDFNIYDPLNEELTRDIKRIREDRIRISAVNKILGLYDLQIDNSFLINLRGIVIKMISHEAFDGKEQKALNHLIKFDLTPSFIPSGNVESFLKLGCITLITLGAPIDALKNGPYFRIISENLNALNNKPLFKAYLEFERLIEFVNSEDKIRINKVKETLNSEFGKFNTFLSYFIYLSLNRILKDKDFDLTKIESEIYDLKNNCPVELAYALSIFGYVHSFDRLYESIHRLSKAPIFDKQITIKKEPVLELEEKPTNKDHSEGKETAKLNPQDKLDKSKIAPKLPKKVKSNQGIYKKEVKGKAAESEETVEPKGHKEAKTTAEIEKLSESEPEEYKVENESTQSKDTYKELDYQTILTAISKTYFKGDNKELRGKLVKDLNSTIQKESANGIEAFGFDTIKTFILQIAKTDTSLKDVSAKVIKKLEELF